MRIIYHVHNKDITCCAFDGGAGRPGAAQCAAAAPRPATPTCTVTSIKLPAERVEMGFVIVKEHEQVLIFGRQGQGRLEVGPRRVSGQLAG